MIVDINKPKSLAELNNAAVGKWFRVRDIITVRDYIVLDYMQPTYANHPTHATVICCEDEMYSTLDCQMKQYVLLTSPEEVSLYKRHKKSAFVDEVILRYKVARNYPGG